MIPGIGAGDFAPLDEVAYRHHEILLRSMHCARPVKHDGKEAFIHTITASQSGGHIDLTVYLAGSPTPISGDQVIVEK